MSEPYHELISYVTVKEQVYIEPSDLHKDLKGVILQKLKNKLEGFCTQYGYIEEIMEILEIESNSKLTDNGTGDCILIVNIRIKRLLPEKGMLIKCKITADDEHMGVFISYDNPIFISIINNTDDEIHKDDMVTIRIVDFQLKHRDTIINITSDYVGEKELKEINVK